MLTMYHQITIQTLYKQGKNKSQIAKLLGCHRHTVRKMLQRETIIEKQPRNKSSMLDPYKQQIEKWQKANISRLRIYEKLQEECNLHCSYINVCKYMQKHFPKLVEAFGVQITQPGEEAELDFGLCRLLGTSVLKKREENDIFTLDSSITYCKLMRSISIFCTYMRPIRRKALPFP